MEATSPSERIFALTNSLHGTYNAKDSATQRKAEKEVQRFSEEIDFTLLLVKVIRETEDPSTTPKHF